MYKKPLFIGPEAGLTSMSDRTPQRAMLDMGMNTGNLLFVRAAMEVLGDGRGISQARLPGGRRQAPLPAESLEGHDCLVVCAANWLQSRTDFGTLAEIIEAADLPTFTLGLGAQAGPSMSIPELTDGTKRFLAVVSERAKSVSVRGAFTAEVLNHYGAKNAEATGCPSLLMMPSVPPDLVKPARAPKNIVLCGSRGAPAEAQLTSQMPTHVMSRLFARSLAREDVTFVAQAELPEINYLISDLCAPADIREEWISFAERYYEMPREDLVPLLMAKMKVFFNFPDWEAFLKGQDFVVGTRLHGVIAGLLSGTPSVLVTHDSRTVEMAEIMQIPSVPARAVRDRVDYSAIYEAADLDLFNARYPEYYRRFRAFFEANDLAHRLDATV
ncbi:MAG: polysaccharide pyruvyl transferase family protein [Pseudomonadota bacterium]